MKTRLYSSSHHTILFYGLLILVILVGNANPPAAQANNLPATFDSPDPIGLQAELTTTSVTHYLPFSPSQGSVRVSRTGLLYRDYYRDRLNYQTITANCNYYSSIVNNVVKPEFCYGYNGEYHDYNDSPSYDRGAIDFGLPEGAAVLASASGKVVDFVFGSSSQPNTIGIQHEDGTISKYLHIKNPQVNRYDVVTGGQKIAEVGPKDNWSSGAHLHYALFQNGQEIIARFADSSARQFNSTEGIVLPSRKAGLGQQSYYRSENTGVGVAPVSKTFVSGRSQFSISVSSVNLEVCASNLAGQVVYATAYRDAVGSTPAQLNRYQVTAGSGCVTFSDMDGVGNTYAGVTYYTVASLNPISDADASAKRTACYSASGQKQLCDANHRLDNNSLTFSGGSSTLTITQASANLDVCASNLSGKTVYATLYRDAYGGYSAKTWRYQKVATSGCVSFADMDGSGDTFTGITYYTVASLNPISDADAASKRSSCYTATNGKQLCDGKQRSYSGTIFESGYSTLEVSQASVNLRVCAANLPGKTVYATLYRDAYGGYAARTWYYNRSATSSCVTFSDMDGSGDTFAGVTYYTVASLNTISASDASSKRTACYSATGGRQLCDAGSRGATAPACYALTTASNPSGGGGVEVSPLNSNGCPTGQYTSGTNVTITAKPTSGYSFLSWSGASGGATTAITIAGNTLVTGNFSTASYNTNWMPDSVFTGEIYTTAGQIRKFLSDRGSCLANPIQDVDGVTIDIATIIRNAAIKYEINPKVILATMQKEQSAITVCPTGSRLAWLMGAGSSSTARAQIDFGTSLFRAYLNELQSNGVTRSGWKVGVPKITQDGVTVTPASRAIAALFTYTPYAGTVWGGNNASIGGTYLFKSSWDMLNFNQAFSPAACFSIDPNVSNPAAGNILLSTEPNCEETKYSDGTVVTLMANPYPGFEFNHWSGDFESAEEWTTIEVTGDLNVTADFTEHNCYYLDTVISPVNGGNIVVDPLPNCTEGRYVENTEVSLTILPNFWYFFDGWSHDISGSDLFAIIKVDGDKVAVANFSPIDPNQFTWIFLPILVR